VKIVSARFERAALRAEDEPRAPGPDVVFFGRSNVGKSSLINKLLGTRGLARTSSQPGRTQSVNFYRINETCWFVDLPGYGYAKVPEAVRRSWKPMVEGCLARRRERIAVAILVVDARRSTTENDRQMQAWLDAMKLPYLVAATKWDKLSQSQRVKARQTQAEGFGGIPLVGKPLPVSAETGEGIRELWRHLDAAIAGKQEEQTAHG